MRRDGAPLEKLGEERMKTGADASQCWCGLGDRALDRLSRKRITVRLGSDGARAGGAGDSAGRPGDAEEQLAKPVPGDANTRADAVDA